MLSGQRCGAVLGTQGPGALLRRPGAPGRAPRAACLVEAVQKGRRQGGGGRGGAGAPAKARKQGPKKAGTGGPSGDTGAVLPHDHAINDFSWAAQARKSAAKMVKQRRKWGQMKRRKPKKPTPEDEAKAAAAAAASAAADDDDMDALFAGQASGRTLSEEQVAGLLETNWDAPVSVADLIAASGDVPVPRDWSAYPAPTASGAAAVRAAVEAAGRDAWRRVAGVAEVWPAWKANGCRLMDDGGVTEVPHAPSPEEAAAALRAIAESASALPSVDRLSLAREQEVRGLVEALRVSPARGALEAVPVDEDDAESVAESAAGEAVQEVVLEDEADAGPASSVEVRVEPEQLANAMESLGGSGAAAAMRALASLGGPALYAEEMEALVAGLGALGWGTLPAGSLCDALGALARTRHYTPALGPLTGALARKGGLLSLRPRQAVEVLWACASLGFMPTAVLRTLESMAPQGGGDLPGWRKLLADLDAGQLARAAWAMSVLDLADLPEFEALWQTVCSPAGKGGTTLTQPQLCQIYQAALTIQLEAEWGADKYWNDDAASLLHLAEGAWNGALARSHTESSYQRRICDALTSLGVVYVREEASTGYSVDVALPDAKIALEVDGPTHLSRTDLQPLGATVLKARHLTALGWNVASARYHEWEGCVGMEEQKAFLSALLADAAAADDDEDDEGADGAGYLE